MSKLPNKILLTALHETRALIAKGWTQQTAARAADNLPVMVNSPKAVAFCLLGACEKAAPAFSTRFALHDLILANLPKPAKGSILEFNDHVCKTKRPILTLLDECIKQLEGQA